MTRNFNPLFFIFMIICSVFLQARDSCAPMRSLDRCTMPHKLFAGPTLLGSAVHAKFDEFDVQGNRCFGGIVSGYEYLKPNRFYANIQLYGAYSNSFTVYQNELLQPSPNACIVFSGLDFRLGYPFTRGNWIVAPFVSVPILGFVSWYSSNGFSEFFSEIGGGLHMIYLKSKEFDIGLDVELFGNFDGFSSFRRYNHHPYQYFNSAGGQFSAPFTWHFKGTIPWDISLEPYLIALDFAEGQFTYGASLKFAFYL